jgi:peptidoglycan/xylan/chitin deacetylase (PgdA/CDA1 family)
MEHLAAGGYKVVGVMAAAEAAATANDPRLVGMSFDDGYRDVAENALPILEQHGFEATVFVATAVVDGSARFDWYDDQPAVLSWPEIVELDRGGTLRFEAHTRTHPNLLALADDAARREIVGSKSDLEERLERPVDVFCYPAGLYRLEHRDLVAAAGFRAAATCDRGVNRPGDDPLLLRRIPIDGTDRMVDFEAKLNGAHDTPLPLQQLYRRFRYGLV